MARPQFDADFVAAVHAPDALPRLGLPEVALAGRSNVGKSSFLNALAGREVARTSRTPGRTRSINYYRAENLVLVDLPGYGYARVSKEERQHWKTLVESYLRRSAVTLVVLLVDARTGPTELDRMMAGWLSQHRRPTLLALTKVDRLRANEVAKAVAAAAATLAGAIEDVVAVSARTGAGVKDARKAIAARLAAAGPTSAATCPPTKSR